MPGGLPGRDVEASIWLVHKLEYSNNFIPEIRSKDSFTKIWFDYEKTKSVNKMKKKWKYYIDNILTRLAGSKENVKYLIMQNEDNQTRTLTWTWSRP